MSRELLKTTVRLMLQNTVVTLELFFSSLALSMVLGLLLAIGRRSKNPLLNVPIRLYLLVMRGTPLILQLMFFYYGPYYIFGSTLKRFTAAVVGLGVDRRIGEFRLQLVPARAQFVDILFYFRRFHSVVRFKSKRGLPPGKPPVSNTFFLPTAAHACCCFL